MTLLDELYRVIGRAASAEVWEVLAGPSTGSTVSIQIGPKHRLDVPLANPSLTEGQRLHEGDISLLIECPWRIESTDELICSWSDSNEPGENMLRGLETLVGTHVVVLEMAAVTMDLKIRLDNGLRFIAFCDSVDSDDDNYSVFDRHSVYVIGPRAKLRRETRGNMVRPGLRSV